LTFYWNIETVSSHLISRSIILKSSLAGESGSRKGKGMAEVAMKASVISHGEQEVADKRR
jgi:hypothetical protein